MFWHSWYVLSYQFQNTGQFHLHNTNKIQHNIFYKSHLVGVRYVVWIWGKEILAANSWRAYLQSSPLQANNYPLYAIFNILRVIVYKIQILAGHLTSPILLKFGMQSCFRVLTTKWMLKSFNSFYFAKYREGRFGVTLVAWQYGGSKDFLLLQSWSCHRNFSAILVTDIKNYPSLSYLSK